MVKDQRAEIIHVDLAAALHSIVSAHPLYWVIFWYRDYPVGQVEIRVPLGEAVDLASAVDRAVEPSAIDEARLRARAPVSSSTANAKISLVICTRDRPDELARCLASLPHQTLMPDEVVVVDNASINDRTRSVSEAAGVTYVREDRAGLDIARNTGALSATGDIVLYTDDDVVLAPRWVERMMAAFEPGIDAVTGIVLPAELESEAQLHFERLWPFGRGFLRRDFGNAFFAADSVIGSPVWEIGAGASMGFRAAVFREVGLFDERLDVGASGCSGDSEYWHRLLTDRRACRYDPAIVAFHFHRRDMSGLRKQLRAYMRGHTAALLVQYQRSGNWGNLRRAFVTLPAWFAQRAIGRYQTSTSSLTFFDEALGYLSGIRFFLKNRRHRSD